MDEWIEKDRFKCPYLLAASFHGYIKYLGSHFSNGILFWHFSPPDKTRDLIEQFETKTEPHIPARDLFEATGTWWREISEMKHGGTNNGRRL